MNIEDEFLKTIAGFSMLSHGDTVLVGVSGGADSMCLLSLLKKFESTFSITVKAAHINHCLRGSESDSDEIYVRNYCDRFAIPLAVLKTDVSSLAKEQGESTELTARKVRYDFFDSLKPDKIATAHTGSDNAETLLMNLSRGASLKGLCGIPPVRDNIIRPLILCKRTDTENYCRENGIDFVTDSSNLTDDYTRNKIRHHVIPELARVFPEFENNVLRCMETLRNDNDYLVNETGKLFHKAYSITDNRFNLRLCDSCSKALFNRVAAAYFSDICHSDFENKHIVLLYEHRNDDFFAFTLPGGITLVIENGFCRIHEDKNPVVLFPEPIAVNKNFPSTVKYGKFELSFSVSGEKTTDKNDYCVDFFSIDDIMNIRPRKSGDAITLKNRGCTKTLKKLFTEMKLTKDERWQMPVLADTKGVVAVIGVGINAQRLSAANTGKYLIIHAESDNNVERY